MALNPASNTARPAATLMADGLLRVFQRTQEGQLDTETHIKQEFCNEAQPPSVGDEHPSLGLDLDYYQAFLDDVDISDAQKVELIETLWQIVVNFIELGFQIHPLNLAQAETNQGAIGKDEAACALERVIGDFAGDALDTLAAYENSDIAELQDQFKD